MGAHVFALELPRVLGHPGKEKGLDLIRPNHKLQYPCFCSHPRQKETRQREKIKK